MLVWVSLFFLLRNTNIIFMYFFALLIPGWLAFTNELFYLHQCPLVYFFLVRFIYYFSFYWVRAAFLDIVMTINGFTMVNIFVLALAFFFFAMMYSISYPVYPVYTIPHYLIDDNANNLVDTLKKEPTMVESVYNNCKNLAARAYNSLGETEQERLIVACGLAWIVLVVVFNHYIPPDDFSFPPHPFPPFRGTL